MTEIQKREAPAGCGAEPHEANLNDFRWKTHTFTANPPPTARTGMGPAPPSAYPAGCRPTAPRGRPAAPRPTPRRAAPGAGAPLRRCRRRRPRGQPGAPYERERRRPRARSAARPHSAPCTPPKDFHALQPGLATALQCGDDQGVDDTSNEARMCRTAACLCLSAKKDGEWRSEFGCFATLDPLAP